MNMIHKVGRYIVCFLLIVLSDSALAQTKDSTAKFSISGYVDVYYATYTDSVGPGKYQKFPTISPRSNEFGLNTFQVNMQYDADKVRAMAVVHYGDIARATWPSNFNNIMEAHAGVKICKTLWLDAGFFRTHFGTEFLLPRENLMSSVSVNTYYEPYYETGVRLNWDPTKKLDISVYLLNGYGMFEENNNKKSLAMSVAYALGDKGSIGYTNYIGDDSRMGDSLTHLRIHENIYLNYQINKLKIQVGGDYCMQQHSDTTQKKSAIMYSGVFSLKYQVNSKYAVYGRYEMFSDPQGCMGGLITDAMHKQTGYKLWGVTAGVEYKPSDNTYIRLEGRHLQMDKDQKIFRWKGMDTNIRQEAMINFGVSF